MAALSCEGSLWSACRCSTLRMHYPMVVQPRHFLQHVLSLSHNELQSLENKHYCLYQFLLRRPQLNAGIKLLPLLVEFYRWVHSNLSFLVNQEQSKQLSIGKTLERFLNSFYQGFKKQWMSKFCQLISRSTVLSNKGDFYHFLCVHVDRGSQVLHAAAKPASPLCFSTQQVHQT